MEILFNGIAALNVAKTKFYISDLFFTINNSEYRIYFEQYWGFSAYSDQYMRNCFSISESIDDVFDSLTGEVIDKDNIDWTAIKIKKIRVKDNNGNLIAAENRDSIPKVIITSISVTDDGLDYYEEVNGLNLYDFSNTESNASVDINMFNDTIDYANSFSLAF